MSYCTLDEAFGNLQLNNVPKQNNMQNNRYNSLNSCVKKNKTKRKRINCNEKKNRFDSNTKDVEINGYNPLKKSFELIDSMANSSNNSNVESHNLNSYSYFSDNFEHFTNSQKPNEIFEYNEEDNKLIEDVSEINNSDEEDMQNNLNENSDFESSDEEQIENTVAVSVKNNRKNNKKNNVIASQISEINNKISFLMNQLNNSNNSNNSNNQENNFKENNIHDIILFVIFGIFVLLVLESLFKLATKILISKNGLNINLS